MEKQEENLSPEIVRPINDTREFVGFMGSLMRGVLDGSVSPEKAKAIVGIGNAMLRGLELNMDWTERMALPPTENMPMLEEPKIEKE